MIYLPVLTNRKNTKIINLIFIIVFLGLMAITFFYIILLRGQYIEVLGDVIQKEVKAHKIAAQYSKSSITPSLNEYDGVDFMNLDKLMSIKKYDTQFNHLRLIRHNNLLQVEGTASQLTDIGTIRNDAKNIGLILEIKQVETDDNGLIKFELNQVES